MIKVALLARTMKLIRVCVTGAGGAGLAAARHLTSELDIFDVSVFEQASCVGGTWVYNEKSGTDERGLPIYSSIYQNLRTNFPKEAMAFPDFPFPSEWKSFLTHQQVLKYLEDYTSHFNLYKYIHFNSAITRVSPLMGEDMDQPQWEVVVTNVDTKESQVHVFEAVIVCSGHFFAPLIPNIPGLHSFSGLLMHSHDYRHPDVFEGKHVVILGAAASGQDICLEVATKAEIVYLSHKGNVPSKLPDNVKQQRPISFVSADGTVHFDDGQQRKVDAILLCTGYEFSFPFLSDACNIEVCNNRVTHLYKHIFNTKYPTLSFIGLCLKVCPFPLFSLQAQYIAAVLSGKTKLPSEKDMNDEEDKDFQEKLSSGLDKKYAHVLDDRQKEYYRTIAHLAGAQPISEIYGDLFKYMSYRRINFLMEYKNDEYKVNADGTWTRIEKDKN